MYDLDIKEEVDRIFKKLTKKNQKQLSIIDGKIKKIRSEPNHGYKFLTGPLKTFNRVHIEKNFVLIFKIDHAKETVVIYYFDHHDNVYKWRPKVE